MRGEECREESVYFLQFNLMVGEIDKIIFICDLVVSKHENDYEKASIYIYICIYNGIYQTNGLSIHTNAIFQG